MGDGKSPTAGMAVTSLLSKYSEDEECMRNQRCRNHKQKVWATHLHLHTWALLQTLQQYIRQMRMRKMLTQNLRWSATPSSDRAVPIEDSIMTKPAERRKDREMFQYVVVVSLREGDQGRGYAPEIIYQYPKTEHLQTWLQKEHETLHRSIPLFCFPDEQYVPSKDVQSETFSFVLTNVDGSRRFGYCRRLLPPGKNVPEVYCIISRLGCFDLFAKVLEEVERRRQICFAMVYPFVQSLKDSVCPEPGHSLRIKSFIPSQGTQEIVLTRPVDSRLEHVEFEGLLTCLNPETVVQVFASLLLERRVILLSSKLSQLSRCIHALVVLLYPFSWQHTYIPVLPPSLIDAVCNPTPFILGLQRATLPLLEDQPMEEVLLVDLDRKTFLRKVGDEAQILPPKLATPLVEDLITCTSRTSVPGSPSLKETVSNAFLHFHVQLVGTYPQHMHSDKHGRRMLNQRAFRKSFSSRTTRHFLKVFMQTQAFQGFIGERETGTPTQELFEQRVRDFLQSEAGS
uniref:DENN/MADD domain containing 2Da n=1 Tax=Eptatretus burgeri TaxID=7764 RepID=A0A8C4NBQ8_EPTBU